MIDLMVSLTIVTVLIALMLPAIALVRESTHKVICASNLRQIGLGINLYAQDRRDYLPGSVFLPSTQRSTTTSLPAYERMDTVWLSSIEFPDRVGEQRWDGMGHLYGQDYLNAANIFYCPSHEGRHRFDEVEQAWLDRAQPDEIIANYLFRGAGPNGARVLYKIESSAALISDTLRSYEDLNHDTGFNVLQAGLSVGWYDDANGTIANDLLLRNDDDVSDTVREAWHRLDAIPANEPAAGLSE